jgi:hypothetical protein
VVLRFQGRRTARIYRESLALARARRARLTAGGVLRPFALVARETGFTELFALAQGPLLEALGRELARACQSAEGVLVFEAILDGRDVLVLDVFAAGSEEPVRYVVPAEEA